MSPKSDIAEFIRSNPYLELVTSLVILVLSLFVAYHVIHFLWTELRWYLYLSGISAVIVSVMFWFDLRRQK